MLKKVSHYVDSPEVRFIERYTNGYLYVDQKNQFQFNFAGMTGFSFQEVLIRNAQKVKVALEEISKIEAGEIMNYTAMEKESENRKVDHYNLRMWGE
jgi:hypothetical protein